MSFTESCHLIPMHQFNSRRNEWFFSPTTKRDWVLISLEVTITLENFLSDLLRVNCEDLYNAIGQLLMFIPSSILMPTSDAVLQVFQQIYSLAPWKADGWRPCKLKQRSCGEDLVEWGVYSCSGDIYGRNHWLGSHGQMGVSKRQAFGPQSKVCIYTVAIIWFHNKVPYEK